VALERFAAERLAEWLPRQRWFASKGRPIVSVAVRDAASLGGRAPRAVLTLLDVVFEQGPGETSLLFLGAGAVTAGTARGYRQGIACLTRRAPIAIAPSNSASELGGEP
jgi:hypothetical protein